MKRRRRAHFLLIAMTIVVIIGVTLAAGGRGHHELATRTRIAELDAVAAQLAGDGRLWIDAHPTEIAALTPDAPISLDVRDACSQSIRPTLTIQRLADSNDLTLSVRVVSGRFASHIRVNLPATEDAP
ncbi:MAG TPA: hypothetical protein P5081_12545 [Phycisphaerae bacterium]|nr:hypothetical protein [Phycisphaerae bacterium]HRW53706.1 hypothetical protein [Phycisphaerae bacterium]